MKEQRRNQDIEKTLFNLRHIIFIILISVGSVSVALSQTIKGKVTDSEGEPLIGVNVVIKGTTTGTVTNVEGDYSIIVNNPEAILVFSYIGYTPQEAPVKDRTTISVVLVDDAKTLDEVVVIGFQKQKKVNLTAAVSYIGADAFENRPVSNVGQALQGAIPGLNIKIDGGNPNKVPELNIRGGTTIRQRGTSNDDKNKFDIVSGAPLILLDGIEISNEDLNQINPADIENMSVLKDASAAAIYGTRATFGVVLIQTKSGSFNQKAKINYTYDISFDQPYALPDILNSYTIYKSDLDKNLWTTGRQYTVDDQKMLDHMMAYINDPVNVKPYFMEGDPVNGTIKWAGNTNPYKELVKDWTPTQKHNLSISGGSDKVSYYLSLGVHDQDGMYRIATDNLKRYNAMLGLNAKITSWFNLGAKASYSIFNYYEPTMRELGSNIWLSAKSYYPENNIYQPVLTGPDDPLPDYPTENPVSYVYTGGKNETSRKNTIVSVSPEFIIIPGELKVKADLSLSPVAYSQERTHPQQGRVNTSWKTLENRWATMNDGYVVRSSTDRYAINVYIDYNKTFAGKHNFSALLGFNQERESYSSSTLTLTNMLDPYILNPTLVVDQTVNKSENTHYILASRALFGRVMYDYMSRYLVEIDMRYDGSSRFPDSDRFQSFPTFSLGWRVSEEAFMESTRSWLNNLKLRGSWGRLGSQPTDRYPYQAIYKTEEGYFLFDGTRYPTGITTPSLINPDLTWEKSTSRNVGLDITVLRNRLNLTADLFGRKTTDILLPGGKDYPALLGDVAPWENAGEIDTYGWELLINWNDKLSNDLYYSVGFSLSDSRTKVLSNPGNPTRQLGDGNIYEGMYLGEIWGYETGGILQNEDFSGVDGKTGLPVYHGTTFAKEQVYPGYLWYKDLNGDGVISDGLNTANSPGDRRIIGNSTPRYRYSITGNIKYKGFDLDLLFQGVGKRDYWIASTSSYWGNGAGSWETYDKSWTPENTGAGFPMYKSTIGSRTQTGYLLNASYFTLRQAIFGYTLPRSLTSKIKLDKVRINVSGYNLFSVTKIPDYFDVEQISDRYPPKRTFALGIQVGF